MSNFSIIQHKLEQFIKKYYTNELIKGAILFFAIGLLYLLVTLIIEYFLWLSQTGRTVLFWSFVAVELALFVRFIAFPLAKLFKLQQGLSHEEASRLIGNHFPEVNDKLLNVIQLNQNIRESELLAASIDQKVDEMDPIPFKKAINFKANTKYLKYAAIPVIIFLFFSVLGDKNMFSSSYERVVNYDTAYEPPAPFSFYVLNDNLSAIENKSFIIQARTEGEVLPENASITYNDETYFLRQTAPGLFEYTFAQPTAPIEFRLKANKVTSQPYTIDVVKTPSLLGFTMQLVYPNYTGKGNETLQSTGNATVPEGTRVHWNVNTQNTDEVALKLKDTAYYFTKKQAQFNLQRGVYSRMDYAISTSNKALKDYENLSFTLNIVRDEYPEIDVQVKEENTVLGTTFYYLGNVSDDYGLTKLQLVYYPENDPSNKQMVSLPVSKGSIDQFTYAFPGDIELVPGMGYEYYFEVFDNDAIHKHKSTKSSIYNFQKLTEDELEQEQLQDQENTIKELDKSLEEFEKQDKRLEELSQTQKEKKELNFNDKKKLEEFLNRQKQQEEMMKEFNEELKENLENFQKENEEQDPFKEQLKDRLEENEERLKENEALLKELEKVQDKIAKEELSEKLEELKKQNKTQKKNLEQLLELTKRYYVNKKAEKLAEHIFKLGEEQEKQADKPEDENTKEAQEKLNEKFEEYKKELENLKKENEQLKEPMDIPDDIGGEKTIDDEQQKATDSLEKGNKGAASESQKKAGKRMKEMGTQMQSSMAGGSQESMEEDVDMLRQIVDNLVVFSFEEEDNMNDFKAITYGSPVFGKKLNKQNELKQNFKHIDDSLFSLSLRQPLIGDKINESLTEINYNIDKALERLAENQMRQGTSSQQYVISGTNELAVLLASTLNSMQMQMQASGSGKGQGKGQGQGQGQGEGFQLPDIIEKQESLSEKMEKGMGEGKGKGEGKGQGEGEGQGEGQGEGDGNGEGQGGNGKGNGDGKGENGTNPAESENNDGELYEIYKEQQQLRQQLQDRLSQEGLDGKGGEILKKMEGVEQQLLDKGFNRSTLEKMLNLNYELLKLDDADLKQGLDSKREAVTNKTAFQNKKRLSPEDIKKYFNTTEILNREALPLRQEFKQKVQEYFNTND
ncbi:hypothetical protein SCB49_06022 [unidentified eubacterium SCB49]|nr:hypothetical protein SCB49_06022 [unidentified eubacterium SCB49]